MLSHQPVVEVDPLLVSESWRSPVDYMYICKYVFNVNV